MLTATEDTTDRAELKYVGATCAGAAAALLKVIPKKILQQAIAEELAQNVITKNLEKALAAYDHMAAYKDVNIVEGQAVAAQDYTAPQWVDVPFEQASVSAPAIHAGLTSVEVKTGLWRTLRPVINYDLCKHCWWVCSSLCPDSAIKVNEGTPQIDYDYCKGCMVCLAQCPPHAISAIAESLAQETEKAKPKEKQPT